jgi:hypothetical protein
MDVRFGHRGELSPEVVERVAVEATRAALEAGRVDQVWRADFRDVNLQVRMLTDEDARGASMIEVDVAQEQVTDVGEREPEPGKCFLQSRNGRCRAAVEERRPSLGLDQVAADDALDAAVVKVD